MSDFPSRLESYAELLIRHGLNVQQGQHVYLQGEVIHRELLYLCAKHAWQAGAFSVSVDFIDPRLNRLRIESASSPEQLQYNPDFIEKKFSDLVKDNGAILRLIGSEDPDLLADLDPGEVSSLQLAYRKKIACFYEEGIGKSKVHWTLAAAATPRWAKKIFPDFTEEEALMLLWEQIFFICRIDHKDYLSAWIYHNEVLQKRAHWLTSLKIKELHFTGPGTDLIVGLSQKALFVGGGNKGPFDKEYEPNIPTEECFTTPDWRMTRGYVTATKPVMMNGVLVEGLKLYFNGGEITCFEALKGYDTFAAYISADVGAHRLGEVALVGIDSPIYQSGLVFRETLYDENAACHIAIGMAYKFCIEGGPEMKPEELAALGCNTSSVHADLMISSEEVSVTATCYDGSEHVLLKKGRWLHLDP